MRRLVIGMVLATSLIFNGCGVGGPTKAPTKAPTVTTGVRGQNFAWGEDAECGSGYHPVQHVDPVTGEVTFTCELNTP